RVEVERIVHAHHLAPLPDHRRIDLVPGVDATVLATHLGTHFGHPFLFSQVRLLLLCEARSMDGRACGTLLRAERSPPKVAHPFAALGASLRAGPSAVLRLNGRWTRPTKPDIR